MVESVECFFKIDIYSYSFFLFIICVGEITKIVKNSLGRRTFGSKSVLELFLSRKESIWACIRCSHIFPGRGRSDMGRRSSRKGRHIYCGSDNAEK